MGHRSSIFVQEYNIITTDRNDGQTRKIKMRINRNYSSKQVIERCTGQMSFYYIICSRDESKVVSLLCLDNLRQKKPLYLSSCLIVM